ncbi:MAG: FAD-dependent oxidoreductase, partial [Candidatus Omnitrophica bacterium]|nr:FAD-dependent oxidoreductase [Candidatus Omnitrophota bacterium]
MKYDYDLMVIGGGAAGLVAATGGAALGARTALVERSRLGGDCTWYGCIPSKALLKAAETFASIRRLDSFGIRAGSANTYDPAGVMDHVRSVVREVSGHHPASLFEERGIRVIFGEGKFLDGNTYEVDGRPLRARRFILTMGSHPVVPPVEGLAGLDYLTNETIFDLESLPKSLAVLGGGPIGAEMAQAFSRLGVGVSIVEMAQRLLFREDSEISGVFSSSLEAEGIGIYTGKKAVAFRQEADGAVVTLEDDEKKRLDIRAEKVLVAAGRGANVSGLDLEKAGIRYSAKGVEVDAALRTSNPAVYAAGDV